MRYVISYRGREVQVTPDTAADLVGRGLAELVEGELPLPAPAVEEVIEDVPEAVVKDVPATVKAVPKSRGKKKAK